MFKKEEIILIKSPVMYLRYITATNFIKAYIYDYTLKRDVEEMQRVSTLTISLFNNQFALDEDKSAVYCAPAIVGKYVRFDYYSEGEQNPFYASSNLHAFIDQVLRWTANRVSEGIYLTKHDCECVHLRRIEPGSFVYENQFYVYPGDHFDIRVQAPPTIKNKYKAYYLFINKEVVSSFLDKQEQILTKLGILSSNSMHDDTGSAKLDVTAMYNDLYNSTPIDIAFIYILLNESFTYDIWVEYPTQSRTL